MKFVFQLKLVINILILSFFSGAMAFANEVISVVASKFPNAEVLKAAEPILKAQGYDLKIEEINSYTGHNIVSPYGKRELNPNLDVINGKYDANFFQPLTYIQQYNKLNGTDLAVVGKVIYIPFAIYLASDKANGVKSITSFIMKTPGLTIGVPADYIDQARALKLLEAYKLIKLTDDEQFPNLANVTANPYKLNIYQADNSALAGMLRNKGLDLIVMNTGRAYLNNIKLNNLSLVENSPQDYANVLVTTKEKSNSPKIIALFKALQSPEVKKAINSSAGGLIKPAF